MNGEICYGTGFPIGWVKYICDGTKHNPENTILVRVPRTEFRWVYDGEGIVKKEVNKHWALISPYFQNYDLIAGTIGKSNGRVFEITNKMDSYLRGVFLHQEFETILLEASDIRYKMVEVL